jgi:uncharacterized Zn-binding protein involved in type VI secretion
MPKLIVVENDPVEGTDTHNITGTATIPSPPGTAAYTGTGRYDYVGKMTDALSDFVTIDGTPVALTSSQSSLNPGESAPPAGKHSGPQGSGFIPPSIPAATIQTATLVIGDVIGTGNPSATAGSAFVTIGGVPVLLDGDSIDTCDGLNTPMNSTVTAENQDFVSCSE